MDDNWQDNPKLADIDKNKLVFLLTIIQRFLGNLIVFAPSIWYTI